MTYTYDITNNIGRVRRTIPDRVEADAIWTDEEIDSFLSDEGNNWRRATALALETMASDHLLVLKVIKVQNIETNTDRMASAMLRRAQALREQAKDAESDDGDAWDIIEMVTNQTQYEQAIWNEHLRGRI